MSSPDEPGSPFVVKRASGPLLRSAAERLVEASGRSGEIAAKEFLAAARHHGIPLDNMWCTVDASSPADGPVRARHVCLAVPGEGATLMCFTSSPLEHETGELSKILETVCRSAKADQLAQTLLRPDEAVVREAFKGAGFRDVGTLEYLQRERPTRAETAGWLLETGDLGDGVALRGVPTGDDTALASALERTYDETLDCPELCGMRETSDVIASHRGTGAHEPGLWWLIESAGTPLGAMLFNPNADQDSVELVYMGVAPELRGKGVATRALRHALATIASRRERLVSCAVDTRNAPARALYEKHGFRRTHTRLALVRKTS